MTGQPRRRVDGGAGARHAPWLALAAALSIAGCRDDASGEPTATQTDTDADASPDGDGSDANAGVDTANADGTGGAGSADGADNGGPDTNGGGTSPPDVAAIEQACQDDCDAKAATGCLLHDSVEQCVLQCVHITGNLDGFCLGEYEEWIECQADTGYECVNDFPTPNMLCSAEGSVYEACIDNLACKRMCRDEMEAGCQAGSWDACVQDCTAERDSHPGDCKTHIDALVSCVANLDLVCDPDVSFDACDHWVGTTGDCIRDEVGDVCAGWCFAAEFLGCGDGCPATCQQRLADPTCGGFFEALANCELTRPDVECADGQLHAVDDCQAEQADHQACLAG